jgi:hypothetical protein
MYGKEGKTDESEKKRISEESDDEAVFVVLQIILENKCKSKCSYRNL